MTAGREEQGVAVRGRFRDDVRAEYAAGARTIVDYDGRAETLSKL